MLSIVLPVYNNAFILRKQLPGLIRFLNEKGIDHEIILVDDGSRKPENTGQVAAEYQCKYIGLGKNLGKGAAVRRGMLEAKGEFRIYTDADVPFHYSAIENFLYYLDFKEFHIVVGDRTLKDSEYFDEITTNRKIGSAIFTFIVGRFVTTGLFDTQCGLKGFRAEIAEDLFGKGRLTGFAFDVELLYLALKRNYDIKRLPVKLRFNESSSVRVFRDGFTMLFDLFKMKWYQVRGKYKK